MTLSSAAANPLFTVFTATYNRAHTLLGVYESLQRQTCRDFEWIIVDDGSTDGTAELVGRWQTQVAFPISYFFQENRGKHVAFNRGVAQARGALFVTFDSDDTCFPDALENFKRLWQSIPDHERMRFANVTGLCVDDNGRIVGLPFPTDLLDAYSVGDQILMRSRGEKWGINRTDVLREFPFPVIEGENWLPEGVVWNRISTRYAARFTNQKFRVYHQSAEALSVGSQLPLRARNPAGTRLYYREYLSLPIPLSWRLREAINYCRFSFHGGVPVRRMIVESGLPLAVAAVLPLGYIAYIRDRRSLRQSQVARS